VGGWSICFDPHDEGRAAGWHASEGFDRAVTVPFPPESADSGIGDTGYHPVVWYQRMLGTDDLVGGTGDDRLLLHFGAVDYRAEVWLDGQLLGRHEGGHTPFEFDVTDVLRGSGASGRHSLVVRVEDDPLDVAQPRGKQDWQREPHSIWYHRSTGIWQPVWLEWVPRIAVRSLAWLPDVPAGAVELALELSRRPAAPVTVAVDLWFEDELLASVSLSASEPRLTTTITLPRQVNGQHYEQLLWSPEQPRLIDAVVTVVAGAGGAGAGASGEGAAPGGGGDASPGGAGAAAHPLATPTRDVVHSYLGLRSAAVEGGAFLLNDRPYYLRSVLSQGFWPSSHLAAPTPDALREEVEVIKSLGFNAARVHQKIEDPRFLYWADRLGLALWAEMPSAYEFSPTAIERVTREWTEVVRRDVSHPSIVTWVPLNESWGVQHIAHSPAVRAYASALADLTRALDPSRPVISNDGWEHLDSDILSVHDYEASGEVVAARYRDDAAVSRLLSGLGPAGRRMRLTATPRQGEPVMLTEFGGVKYAVDSSAPGDAWGYSTASSAEDFDARLTALLSAVRASSVLAGFCYTQLTDTGQEVNGLLTADRRPKLPVERLRAIVTGEG
jgi:beta-galactosidase/beta-glucuronidase